LLSSTLVFVHHATLETTRDREREREIVRERERERERERRGWRGRTKGEEVTKLPRLFSFVYQINLFFCPFSPGLLPDNVQNTIQ
jgi:hypothetical protein